LLEFGRQHSRFHDMLFTDVRGATGAVAQERAVAVAPAGNLAADDFAFADELRGELGRPAVLAARTP
jgi:hypothetical protein